MGVRTIKERNKRQIEAFDAAQRILDLLEKAGYYIWDPEEIICNADYLPIELNCNWGASRVTIWDNHRDYVIKVAREPEYEKYNAREAEICSDAFWEGLEDMFAWCTYYIEPEDEYSSGVLVMEFLEGDEDEIAEQAYSYGLSNYRSNNNITKLTSDDIEEYQSEINDEEEILEFVAAGLDDKKTCRFWDFLSRKYINDIHSGNVLFNANGAAVICGYAGWGW